MSSLWEHMYHSDVLAQNMVLCSMYVPCRTKYMEACMTHKYRLLHFVQLTVINSNMHAFLERAACYM